MLLSKRIVFIRAFRKYLIFSSETCCKAYLAIYRKIFVTKDVRDIWRYIVRYILRYRQILGAENIRDILRYYLAIKDKPKYLTSMPQPDKVNIGKPWRIKNYIVRAQRDQEPCVLSIEPQVRFRGLWVYQTFFYPRSREHLELKSVLLVWTHAALKRDPKTTAHGTSPWWTWARVNPLSFRSCAADPTDSTKWTCPSTSDQGDIGTPGKWHWLAAHPE